MSHSTYELLNKKVGFLERGAVAIKGKSEMKTLSDEMTGI